MTPQTPTVAPELAYKSEAATGMLTATNTVTISWPASEVGSDARYEIVRTTQQDCPMSAVESCAGYTLIHTKSTRVEDKNVPWGEVYYYFMRVGRSSYGVLSGYSPVRSVTVPVLAPRQVTLNMSGTTANVSWDSLPGVDYDLLISKDASCDTDNVTGCTDGEVFSKGGDTSHIIRLLDVGSEYYFWVKAKHGAFADVSATPANRFIDPFSPSAFNVAQKSRDLELSWDGDRNTDYTVWRWFSCSSEPDLSAAKDAANSVEALCQNDQEYTKVPEPYTDTNVTPGTPYYYAIQAHAGGKSAVRSIVKKKVLKAPMPTDFSVTVRGSGASVFFTKDTEFPTITYNLYRAANADCDVTQPATCQQFQSYTDITTGHVDSGLKGNRTYYYWLEASIGVDDAKNLSAPVSGVTGSIVLKASSTRSFSSVSAGKCIQEADSGLRWAVLETVDAVAGGLLTDPDDTFEFLASTDSGRNANNCGLGALGQKAPSCTTGDVVKRFNDASICGRTNWRLPTLSEMQTIIDFQHAEANKSAFYSELTPSETTFEYWVADANNAQTQAVAVNENGGKFSLKSTVEKLKVRLVSPGVQ